MKEKTQSEILMEILGARENEVRTFHDRFRNGYIEIKNDGHYEVLPIRGKDFKHWLVKQFWELNEKSPHKDAISDVLSLLEARAIHDGKEHELNNRIAEHDSSFWYDLTNSKWQSVEITTDGWKLIEYSPILFKRYGHQLAQVLPQEGGDIRSFLKYVNVASEDDQLLLLVFLVSCFVPDIAHVILVVFGPQGSAKSTLSKLLRRLVDPSLLDVSSFPSKKDDLPQMLEHHAFTMFDNVSYISQDVSDLLCKAITGSGFTKRELYSDDSDVIYNIKRCFGINGINLVSTRPDLLERSLLIGLERISPENRKTEKNMMGEFQKDLPFLLGSIFTTLSRAKNIHPTVEVSSLPRMADFAIWGCAIAEALGYSRDDFLRAYNENIKQQKDTVLNESPVAQTLLVLMADKDEYIATPTALYQKLNEIAWPLGIDTKSDSWPKAPNFLMRRLNEIVVSLADAGIFFSTSVGHERTVRIYKKSTEGVVDVVDIGSESHTK